MPRYIDADKLEELCDIMAEKCGGIGKSIWSQFLTTVEWIPTADVAEVKHGNWVGIDDDPCETFECDRCGFVLDDWIQGALYNYCPNCGADMR